MRLFSTKLRSKSFYEVLQIPHNSSLKEIKSQYYKLCKLLHPDTKNTTEDLNESQFQEITTAYETLKDSKKRREYDRSLALTKYQAPATGLKDFEFKRKTEFSMEETIKFWSKRETENQKNNRLKEEHDALNERLEEMKVFRNRILVVGAMLFGYWLSSFGSS